MFDVWEGPLLAWNSVLCFKGGMESILTSVKFDARVKIALPPVIHVLFFDREPAHSDKVLFSGV